MNEAVNILYMDDNEGTARLLAKRLSRAGYVIDTVFNGEDGLERCNRQVYDVIIVDYEMPGLNGLQVIQELITKGIHCPIIVLTGTGNERVAVEALKLGAVDYMVKDIDGIYFELLPTTINQALKNQQLLAEKLRAEEALRESEDRFRMLFEKAPNPYFVSDFEGYIIDCNQALEPLLGMPVAKLIGKHFTEMPLFNQGQIAKVALVLAEMSEDTFTDPIELDVTRPDGQILVFDLRMIAIRTKGQTQILGIGNDITWRKQAELRMKAHINQLESLSRIDDELTRKLDIHYVQNMALDNMMYLSNANAGSIALMADGHVLAVQSIGYPEELNQYYKADGRSIVARVARQRVPEWVDDVSKDPDYYRILDDTCSQITIPLLSQGRLIGILNLETNQADQYTSELFELLKVIATRVAAAIDNAQLYDMSQKQLIELQDLYEQVSQLEQLKTDMIRLAAHDLRNPMTSILTKTYLLRMVLVEMTEKQVGYIDAIDDAVTQMQSLITDFLSIERIEEKFQGESERQNIDLKALVQRVSRTQEQQAQEKDLSYNFFTANTPLIVSGFEIELQQVIANLIGNAIKYTARGGSITVSLERQDMMALFEVTDSGYGIPDTEQQRLFQPFSRVQDEDTQSIEGTGLGLYLVKKFVERNKGEIIFHSVYGKGSTFGFKLPLLR